MTKTAQIEIKLSKARLRLMLIGSMLFFILAVWMISGFHTGNSSPFFIKLVGILGAVFFGAAFVFLWKKVTDDKPGITLNDEGITDNSSGVSAGYIPWSDILDIKPLKVFNQHFLLFVVSNPNAYIEKEADVIKRKAMQLNFKNYGSPISISANALDCTFHDLKHLMEEGWRASKAR